MTVWQRSMNLAAALRLWRAPLLVAVIATSGCDGLWQHFLETRPDTLVPLGRPCAGSAPYWVAIGDVDKDGNADLVVVNNDSKDVMVLTGDGVGRYQHQQRLSFADNPRTAALLDLNKDGSLDLAVGLIRDTGLATQVGVLDVFFGLPGGGFPDMPSISLASAGKQPVALVADDLTGDGQPDIAVADEHQTMSEGLLLYTGATFQTRTANSAIAPVNFVSSALQSDGRAVLVAPAKSSQIYIENEMSGTPVDLSSFPSQSLVTGVAVADFDEDGTRDVALTNYDAHSLQVSLSLGKGATRILPISFAGSPWPIGAGDFNEDGHQDLVVGDNAPASQLHLLLGDGSGQFRLAQSLPIGPGPRHLAVSDLNRDGVDDVVVTGTSSSQLTVFYGSGPGGPLRNIDPAAVDGSTKQCPQPN